MRHRSGHKDDRSSRLFSHMVRSRNLTLRIAAVAVFIVLAVSSVLESCSGCSHGDGAKTADTVTAKPTEAILAEPQRFDDQGLRGYVSAINAGETLDETDMAKMIVLAEAAFNRLEQEAEDLQRTDDPVDTFETLTQIKEEGWAADAATAVAFLRTVPLKPQMQDRVNQLTVTAGRVITLLRGLTETHLDGQTILTIDISPRSPR